jgi:hypothetical protein
MSRHSATYWQGHYQPIDDIHRCTKSIPHLGIHTRYMGRWLHNVIKVKKQPQDNTSKELGMMEWFLLSMSVS